MSISFFLRRPFFLFPVLIGLFGFSAWNGQGNESIGFAEKFALAEDRAAVISELVPGTADFYYYSSLLAQQEGRFDEVDTFLEPWIKRHGRSPRVDEIQHRQALLRYSENPGDSLAYLKKHLGLRFDHQQQKLDAKPNFPTTLNQELVTWDAFAKRSIQKNSLGEVRDSGLDRIIRDEVVLNELQRRELLGRLKFSDYDRLVGLIAADLRTKSSRGFGEFEIHRRLTLAQLDELLGLRPTLIQESAFVDAKLIRLRPNDDISLDREPEERKAYLDRLLAFVRDLDPTFNSLKASVLYRQLDQSMRAGEFPVERFLEYLRLPRSMPYMEPKYLNAEVQKGGQTDLNADFSETIGHPPVGNDEKLVRAYLEHFFIEDESINRFSPYVRETYLKRLFAETKLLNGIGDAQEWYSMLSPSSVEELKNRVAISFSATNREHLAADDEVSLGLTIKNVNELIVKVYQINTLNYYLDQKREINTDLNLDGLVANEEKTYRYDSPPILSHAETFSFESMKGKRGVWVVEFIGNGISSRALVRKGKLQYLSAATPGGERVRILTEQNKAASNPAIWFGGKRYEGDEKGFVLLPFSEAGNVPIILEDGDFSSFSKIELPREKYKMKLSALLETETLLPGNEAEVAIRSQLELQGEPVSNSLLESVVLRVKTVDQDGIESLSEAKDFALFDDRESIHRFRVPNRLRHVTVSLSGKLDRITDSGNKQELVQSASFDVNGSSATEVIHDVFFSKVEDRHILEVLGRTGERMADHPVDVALHHPDFAQPYRTKLKTNESGRVNLGRLDGIDSIAATVAGVQERRWSLRSDQYSHPRSINVVAGKAFFLPRPGVGDALDRSELAIFEKRLGVPVVDHFSKVKTVKGGISVSDLEPGDYEILLRGPGRKLIEVSVTRGEAAEMGYSLSQSRHLQLTDPNPMCIASLESDPEQFVIQLANPGEDTRVHVIASRFVTNSKSGFLSVPSFPFYRISRGTNESLYLSGRDIGEEYRYILERRSSKRFPGVMLPRPGLILNPWELNKTKTAIDDAEKGEDYKKSRDMKEVRRGSAPPQPPSAEDVMRESALSPSFDFLAEQAVFFSNLKVGEDGRIVIPKKDLGDRQYIQVFAVDQENVAYREAALPDQETGFRDLRLRSSLDAEKAFTQQRHVTLLEDEDVLTIKDLRAAELESYSTVGEVFSTLAAIQPNPDFQKFSFIRNWPGLDAAAKRKLYSEFACHELNFFLSRKDPEFFREVIQPYLKHKKDKTFFDHYLIESDLSGYLAPWEFGRLNIVERILLARRIGEGETRKTASHVKGLQDMIPPDRARNAMVFRQALRSRRSSADGAGLNLPAAAGAVAVEADAVDAFGYADAAVKTKSMRRAPMDPFSPAPEPAAAPAGGGAKRSAGKPVAALQVRGARMLGRADLESLREEAKQQVLYRKLEATKEWAENNYYQLPIYEQGSDLVTTNAFWLDFAEWDGKGGFYSREFPEATRNLSEMMLALAVLDLPFSAEEHEIDVNGNELKFTARSPVVIFHEEIEEAERMEEASEILVSQNFFRVDDRYRFEDGIRSDHFVTKEFLTGVVYGSQIVATNPTSAHRQLELLVQIPQGAIPLAGSDYLKSNPLLLGAFSTSRIEVQFYFPEPSGEESFSGYPVQVAVDEKVIASGAPRSFRVVEKPSEVDETSWQYLSQFGTEKEVLDYLRNANFQRTNLALIAWRARENVDFFREVTNLVAGRHGFDLTLWSYGLHHNVTAVANEYLKHREDFLSKCGKWIRCELVSLDPVDRHWYQHLEYAPLVNARTHRLGRERSVLNDRFRNQYGEFLDVISYKPQLNAEDELAATAYLFLQDRIEEALERLAAINPEDVQSRLQFDYLRAYASLYREEPGGAREIAAAYLDHPVERWRDRFGKVDLQVKSIEGEEVENDEAEAGDLDGREEELEKLSANDPFFELSAVGREAEISFRNLEEVTVNYYEMDLEFLFSSKPFVSGDSGQFSYIRPNRTEAKKLPEGDGAFRFAVPEEFSNSNLLVEVVAAGKTEAVAVYSNQLKVQLSDKYGRVEVRHEETGKPLPKTYVKVYARMKDGGVKFFKDGYTDLRGKFDYVSLNTDELDQVDQLSLLVMSDDNGSLVREVKPPQR